MNLWRHSVGTWLLGFCVLFCAVGTSQQTQDRVVCYYTNWSVYRPGTAKFNPQNINPYLCTHLIYAFGGFTKDNALKPFDKYQDIEQGGYAKFTGLKTYNKQLKTMLAIGGWNEGSSRFSALVAKPDRRQQLVKNAVKFLRQNHFDGLDLDWEYPSFRDGGKPKDRENYAQLVQELREEFERESSKTGRPRLLLTMAVPAGVEYIEKGYDIPKLNKYLDWFNLLSYDYHSAFEPSVNHHSPLYSMEEESEYNYDGDLNIHFTIKTYLEAGADKDKIVLGIPTYGRSYTLFNPDATEIGAPADGPGEQGDATREKGYLAYYEICENLKDNDEWTVVQPNPDAMGPYAYLDNQWVGYDDEAIVKKKAEYVAQEGLGGIMFWAIDNDDFRGTCHGRPYPLIEAAKEAMLSALGTSVNDIGSSNRRVKPNKSRSRGRQTTSTRVTGNRFNIRSRQEKEEEVVTPAPRRTSGRRRVTAKPIVEEEVVVQRVSSSRKRPASRRRSTTAAPVTTSATTPEPPSVSYARTTPEPPTTPDPGSDFKCEEEGFFPHPRDCKKYFWCLDSGPSQLGIVAHQFTCPSGLYFNKAADSCDYTRNVLCDKKLGTTTTTTTAKPATTTTATTTTRASLRITAATSATSRRVTTTTTTPASEEYEYEDDEYEDESPRGALDSEEDPRVIKELIDLIKKVGGVEELEKQLRLQEEGSSVKISGGPSTTPATISRSLYDRLLSKSSVAPIRKGLTTLFSRNTTPAPKVVSSSEEIEDEEDDDEEITVTKTRYTSINRNSRPGPQNAGLENNSEAQLARREKPKYVTISRNRPATSQSDEEVSEESEASITTAERSRSSVYYKLGEGEDDEDSAEEDDEIVEDKNVATRRTTQTITTPQYVNIRRQRPTTTAAPETTASAAVSEVSAKSEKESGELTTEEKKDIMSTLTGEDGVGPEYIIIRRNRPSSVQEEVTTSKYKTIERVRFSTEAASTFETPEAATVSEYITTTSLPETTSTVIPSTSSELPRTYSTIPKRRLETLSTEGLRNIISFSSTDKTTIEDVSIPITTTISNTISQSKSATDLQNTEPTLNVVFDSTTGQVTQTSTLQPSSLSTELPTTFTEQTLNTKSSTSLLSSTTLTSNANEDSSLSTKQQQFITGEEVIFTTQKPYPFTKRTFTRPNAFTVTSSTTVEPTTEENLSEKSTKVSLNSNVISKLRKTTVINSRFNTKNTNEEDIKVSSGDVQNIGSSFESFTPRSYVSRENSVRRLPNRVNRPVQQVTAEEEIEDTYTIRPRGPTTRNDYYESTEATRVTQPQSRGRYRPRFTTPVDSYSDYQQSSVSRSTPARRFRPFLTTTVVPDDGQYYQDDSISGIEYTERKYRPLYQTDLSSLTAFDRSRDLGGNSQRSGGNVRTVVRRYRPTTTTTEPTQGTTLNIASTQEDRTRRPNNNGNIGRTVIRQFKTRTGSNDDGNVISSREEQRSRTVSRNFGNAITSRTTSATEDDNFDSDDDDIQTRGTTKQVRRFRPTATPLESATSSEDTVNDELNDLSKSRTGSFVVNRFVIQSEGKQIVRENLDTFSTESQDTSTKYATTITPIDFSTTITENILENEEELEKTERISSTASIAYQEYESSTTESIPTTTIVGSTKNEQPLIRTITSNVGGYRYGAGGRKIYANGENLRGDVENESSIRISSASQTNTGSRTSLTSFNSNTDGDDLTKKQIINSRVRGFRYGATGRTATENKEDIDEDINSSQVRTRSRISFRTTEAPVEGSRTATENKENIEENINSSQVRTRSRIRIRTTEAPAASSTSAENIIDNVDITNTRQTIRSRIRGFRNGVTGRTTTIDDEDDDDNIDEEEEETSVSVSSASPQRFSRPVGRFRPTTSASISTTLEDNTEDVNKLQSGRSRVSSFKFGTRARTSGSSTQINEGDNKVTTNGTDEELEEEINEDTIKESTAEDENSSLITIRKFQPANTKLKTDNVDSNVSVTNVRTKTFTYNSSGRSGIINTTEDNVSSVAPKGFTRLRKLNIQRPGFRPSNGELNKEETEFTVEEEYNDINENISGSPNNRPTFNRNNGINIRRFKPSGFTTSTASSIENISETIKPRVAPSILRANRNRTLFRAAPSPSTLDDDFVTESLNEETVTLSSSIDTEIISSHLDGTNLLIENEEAIVLSEVPPTDLIFTSNVTEVDTIDTTTESVGDESTVTEDSLLTKNVSTLLVTEVNATEIQLIQSTVNQTVQEDIIENNIRPKVRKVIRKLRPVTSTENSLVSDDKVTLESYGTKLPRIRKVIRRRPTTVSPVIELVENSTTARPRIRKIIRKLRPIESSSEGEQKASAVEINSSSSFLKRFRPLNANGRTSLSQTKITENSEEIKSGVSIRKFRPIGSRANGFTRNENTLTISSKAKSSNGGINKTRENLFTRKFKPLSTIRTGSIESEEAQSLSEKESSSAISIDKGIESDIDGISQTITGVSVEDVFDSTVVTESNTVATTSEGKEVEDETTTIIDDIIIEQIVLTTEKVKIEETTNQEINVEGIVSEENVTSSNADDLNGGFYIVKSAWNETVIKGGISTDGEGSVISETDKIKSVNNSEILSGKTEQSLVASEIENLDVTENREQLAENESTEREINASKESSGKVNSVTKIKETLYTRKFKPTIISRTETLQGRKISGSGRRENSGEDKVIKSIYTRKFKPILGKKPDNDNNEESLLNESHTLDGEIKTSNESTIVSDSTLTESSLSNDSDSVSVLKESVNNAEKSSEVDENIETKLESESVSSQGNIAVDGDAQAENSTLKIIIDKIKLVNTEAQSENTEGYQISIEGEGEAHSNKSRDSTYQRKLRPVSSEGVEINENDLNSTTRVVVISNNIYEVDLEVDTDDQHDNEASTEETTVSDSATETTTDYTTDTVTETTTEYVSTTPYVNKLLAIERPKYKPKRPSSLSPRTTERTVTSTRSYRRKYISSFSPPPAPPTSDGSTLDIGASINTVSIRPKTRFTPRPLIRKVTRPRPITPDENEEEESEYYDEDEEIKEEVERKPFVARPAVSTLNEDNEQEDEEEDYEEEEKHLVINKDLYKPKIPPILISGIKENEEETEEYDEEDVDVVDENDEHSENKDETLSFRYPVGSLSSNENDDRYSKSSVASKPLKPIVNHPSGYIHPASTARPRVVNNPYVSTESSQSGERFKNFPSSTEYIHPASRSYTRKYVGSSTTEAQIDLSLIEELDIEALNARNKKIFDSHKKLPSTFKPSSTTTASSVGGEETVTVDPDINTVEPETTGDTTTELYTTLQYSTDVDSGFRSTDVDTEYVKETTEKPSTYPHHIFAVDPEATTAINNINTTNNYIENITSKKIEKLFEINRIIEVSSKENKYLVNHDSKENKVETSSGVVLERFPTLDRKEAVSRLTLIKVVAGDSPNSQNQYNTSGVNITNDILSLSESNNAGYDQRHTFLDVSDNFNSTGNTNSMFVMVTNVTSSDGRNKTFTIDSKSSIADYSPTEYYPTEYSTESDVVTVVPVVGAVDGGVPPTVLPLDTELTTVELPTSTLPIQGEFGKDKKPRILVYKEEAIVHNFITQVPFVSSTESSTIALEALFHPSNSVKQPVRRAKQFVTETVNEIESIIHDDPVEVTTNTNLPTLHDLVKPSGRSIDGLVKIQVVPNEVVVKNFTYTKSKDSLKTSPIAISILNQRRIEELPLETTAKSNTPDTSPIVISISNLDQVLLQKTPLKKQQTSSQESSHENESKITVIQPQPVVNTRTSYSVSQSTKRIFVKRLKNGKASQNDISNIQLINILQPETETNSIPPAPSQFSTAVDNSGAQLLKVKIIKPISVDETPIVHEAIPPIRGILRRPGQRPGASTESLTENSSSTEASSSSSTERKTRPPFRGTKTTIVTTPRSAISATTSLPGATGGGNKRVVVRRKYRPRGGERSTTTSKPSLTVGAGDSDASTESPRTTLFKKRSRFTTTRRPVTKPSTTDIPDEPTIGSSILLTPEDKESSAIIINKNDQVVGSSIRQSTAHGNNISLVQKLVLSRTENKYSNKGVTGINQVIPEDNLEADLSHEDHTEADIAIAVHNLAGAPLPTLQTYDEDNSEDDYIHTEKKSTTVTTTKRPTARRPQKTRISTTVAPQVTRPVVVRNRKPEPFSKISAVEVPHRTYRPIIDYDYYDDGEVRVVGRQPTHEKVLLHSSGTIECLDQGNFPHPASCKKFISCAKMENGGVVGWEYTCPKGLSYDPVGGICNWSAGLGCKD